MRAVFALHRGRARVAGVPDGEPGSVTFVQRFGSSLSLNLHFHCVIPDGVFVEPDAAPPGAPLAFHDLSAPGDEDVEALLRRVAIRVLAMLRRNGRLDDDLGPDDALDALRASSTWQVMV